MESATVRKVLQLLFAVVCVLLFCGTAGAQTITNTTVRFYNVGAPQPIAGPTTIPLASYVCNQTPPAAASPTVNPTKIVFDDTVNANKACVYTDSGTGPLLALPFGTNSMEATLMFVTSTGISSPESARSNSFTRPGVAPTAPTGVKVAG